MTTFYIAQTFRKLTDEQVGMIQHRIIDLGDRAIVVAADFGVSVATVYRAKAAVPEDLLTFDDVGLLRFRAKHDRRKKTKASRRRIA